MQLDWAFRKNWNKMAGMINEKYLVYFMMLVFLLQINIAWRKLYDLSSVINC